MQSSPGSLSIEILHLHPWKLEYAVAEHAARVAQRYIGTLLDRRRRLKQPTGCVVMLDDYFLSGSKSRIERILGSTTETLVQAADDAGLWIDSFVKESAMADAAPHVLEMLQGRVRDGVLHAESPYRRFGIEYVPLWTEEDGERRWTCPFLAATWQLVRLGIVEIDAAAFSKVAAAPAPVITEDTLTLLSSRYLATEAAVQAICASLGDEGLVEYVADHSAHLFVPDSEDTPFDGATGPARTLPPEECSSAVTRLLQGSRPALSLDGPSTQLVIDGDGTRPYALWDLVEVGPETLALSQRVVPTADDAEIGNRAMVTAAAELGYATLLLAGEAEAASSELLTTVACGPSWKIQMRTSPRVPGGNRDASGHWLPGQNPPQATTDCDWVIERPSLADLDEMLALDASEYLVPVSARSMAEAVLTWPAAIARAQDQLLGSVTTRPLVGADGKVGELYTIVTAPAYRSRGIGAALLESVEALAWLHGWDALWLESSLAYSTRHKGSAAPFYLRHGWTLVAESGRTIYFAKARPGAEVYIHPSITGTPGSGSIPTS